MSARLVVVTANYPFVHNGGEVMFVAPEMQRLARQFGALTVAPLHAGGARLPVPEGVEVDTSLARRLRRGRIADHVAVLFEPDVRSEAWRGLRRGGFVGAARVWRWAAVARATAHWAHAALPANAPRLLYTYWRGGSTVAFAALAERRPMTAAITRVHRYELYEDAFSPPFQPWHPTLYARLALTATISQHGLDYLRAAGVDAARLGLYRLGTEPFGARTRASAEGALRVVSCSSLTPVKRVPLIAQALVAFARRHAHCRVGWVHFGGGPELSQVQAALRDVPANLDAVLAGQVPNDAVRAHYAAQPVDAFVLLSESEGLPVSIQEAASAGVPVIATDVGGVAELVGSDNGVLLRAACDVAEVVAALERILLKPDSARREASWRRWVEGFDAERNHSRFAAELQTLLDALAADTSSSTRAPHEI